MQTMHAVNQGLPALLVVASTKARLSTGSRRYYLYENTVTIMIMTLYEKRSDTSVVHI